MKYIGEKGGKHLVDKMRGLVQVADHDEVDALYEQYVDSVLNPKPKTYYAYLTYPTGVLHFTHNKQIYDRDITDEYVMEPTSTHRPWSTDIGQYITTITSDRIVAPYSLKGYFSGLYNLKDISGLKNWDTSFTTDMQQLFYGCSSLKSTDALSNWDTSSNTILSEAFRDCSQLLEVDGLATWDMSALSSYYSCLKYTFWNCSMVSSFESLNGWNIPEHVFNKQDAHYWCFHGTSGTLPSWVPDDAWERSTWVG